MNAIAVDAACSGNPGIMEYRGVDMNTRKQIFHQGPFPDATNNIGEFLALVHALALLKKLGLDNTTIYTDSITAMAWVRNKKAKTKMQPTPKNTELIDLVLRAENWLHTNTYKNPILKWDTVALGEIPADFGRKK
jgi:ribonuclease HI